MVSNPTSLARETFAYGHADGLPLELDVLGAEPVVRGAVGAQKPGKPCVMWIHGGGLIFGSRTISPRPGFVQALLARGFVIVSIDHRLAPQTQLESIFDDVQLAWRWLHEQGPALLGVDIARLAIAGASAGAYLSLLAGCHFTPRPRAIASFWGFGDITAPWEAEPSAHYRAMDLVPAEKAWAAVSAAATSDPSFLRSDFYLYCRQQGQWLQHVTGHDLQHGAGWFEPWCPLKNIDTGFPPTLLLHGQVDTDVPHEETARLAERLAACGVHHRFISLPGVGHGFAGAAAVDVDVAEGEVANFLLQQLP